MLEIKVENSSVKMTVQGDTVKTVAELGLIIHNIYSALHRQNAEASELFRAAMRITLLNESPVWQPDDDISGIAMVWPKKRDDE